MKIFKAEKKAKRIGKGQKKLSSYSKASSKKKTGSRKKVLKKLPYTVKSSKRQYGKTNKPRDKARVAMSPGKRKSKSDNIYYENRKNRSDLKEGI